MVSRIPYFLLVLVCVIAVASTFATGNSKLKSVNAVKDLLAAVRNGDINAARQLLGDNTCNCPPTGGWVSLLKYESGHEPNLAFLLRQKFLVSNIQTSAVPVSLSYIFPWDKPEDRRVDLRIQFLSNPPYYLPLKLAYGIPMSLSEFKQWCNTFANETNPRAFTLRLRNSLAPGTIPQAKPDKHELLLPPEVRAFVHPRDCAAVLDGQGKPLHTLALPHLQFVHASFLVVRRGVLSPWTIKSVKFTQPQWLVQ